MTTIKVYKIVNNINDDIYIGSTKTELRKRFYRHKVDSNRVSEKLKVKGNKLYSFARDVGWDCFRIILIEEVECKNKEEQLQKEQQYIDLLKPKFNKINAHGFDKDKRKEWFKSYTSQEVVREKKRTYDKKRNKTEHRKEYRRKRNEYTKVFREMLKLCNLPNFDDELKCLICNKKYSSKSSLKRHNKMFHF